MKNPFETAIAILENAKATWATRQPLRASDLDGPIRVLEAAGKVDKKKCELALIGSLLGEATASECQEPFGMLNNLLAALPDKERP